jgi:hypothetical protein
MPVNTAALKTFAPAMRRQLLEAVGRKLDLLLNSQTPDTLSTYATQIAELREQEAENRDQLLERVAYTWFNRLCALRYLDARGWHPFGCKVLMPAAEGETQPELLKLMRAGNLPAALQSHSDEGRLHGLLDGQIQTAIAGADPQGEVYRQLVLAVCRCYHELLPNLFEGLDDASELLLPDDLLSDGSIVGAFRKEMNDDDCQDVESLGWLYQFYIAEKKDEVMARKKAVPTEDIPAVTQLFTPHWIVRYLVENSLGRLWLLNRPGSKLRDQMPYYIESVVETDFLVINKPEEIKLLDPACGSGHMLTYAFDLLVLIYEEEGYSPNEIPGLILKHNLHGLEICPRAAQLAELALVFKAREQSRRFFQPEQLVRPQIIELQDVQFADGELNDYIEALDLGELFDPNLFKLLHQFEEAKTFGSLIQPCLDEQVIAEARRAIEAKDLGSQIILRESHLKVLRVLEQANLLIQRYHIVVANPPYMEARKYNSVLKGCCETSPIGSTNDLYQAFVLRSLILLQAGGLTGFVTKQGWMFTGDDLYRRRLLQECNIVSLLDIGYNCFPEMNSKQVLAAAYVIESSKSSGKSVFVDLNTSDQSADKEKVLLARLSGNSKFVVDQHKFLGIRNTPLAYWLSDRARDLLNGQVLADHADVCQGLITGNNELFLRYWHEVARSRIETNATSIAQARESRCKWYPISKGGVFRKWYGNHELVVNWHNNGKLIREYGNESGRPKSRVQNSSYYFRQGITWSTFTSSPASFRLLEGSVFSSKGSACFPSDQTRLHEIMSILNSCVAKSFLRALCPTLDYMEGPVGRIPLLMPTGSHDLGPNAHELIQLSKADWDANETSWDFAHSSLLDLKGCEVLVGESKSAALRPGNLSSSWALHSSCQESMVARVRDLETQNNRILLRYFGLGDELDPEVDVDDVGISRACKRKDITAFLSYATGCMMGRYSLDHTGLILADCRDSQSEQLAAYEEKVGKLLSKVQFKPDPDGIIPVLDGEWFEDDIVARTREFLAVTFPESTVVENLRFIEESLGKDIRKYFCSEFYKDHLQTYKKRPIYWMVQSPKKGFACLIYLHRYTKDTLNQVLNNYFRPYLQKLEARLAQLGLDQLNDDLPARERTAARKEAEKITKVLKECQAWEQDALLPLAQQRIELDLDDGVKVNYLKLQDVLAPIPGLAAKED